MSNLYDDAILNAAIKAYWRTEEDGLTDGFMPAVLAAVAPAIAARALREAAEVWASDPDSVDDETPADARNWLRTRADEIERRP